MITEYYRVRSIEKLKENPEGNIEDYLEFICRVKEEIGEEITDKIEEYCYELMEEERNNTEYNSFFNLEELITKEYNEEKIKEEEYKEMISIIKLNKMEYRRKICSNFYRFKYY